MARLGARKYDEWLQHINDRLAELARKQRASDLRNALRHGAPS